MEDLCTFSSSELNAAGLPAEVSLGTCMCLHVFSSSCSNFMFLMFVRLCPCFSARDFVI